MSNTSPTPMRYSSVGGTGGRPSGDSTEAASSAVENLIISSAEAAVERLRRARTKNDRRKNVFILALSSVQLVGSQTGQSLRPSSRSSRGKFTWPAILIKDESVVFSGNLAKFDLKIRKEIDYSTVAAARFRMSLARWMDSLPPSRTRCAKSESDSVAAWLDSLITIGRLTPLTISILWSSRNMEAISMGAPPNISVIKRTPLAWLTLSIALSISSRATSALPCQVIEADVT